MFKNSIESLPKDSNDNIKIKRRVGQMSKQIIRRSLPKQIQDKIDKKSSRSPNEQRRNL